MKVITYRLLLEQPLLATQLLGDPNSSVSLPYVPGSLLRGMLIHRYLEREQLNGSHDLFADTTCQRLFFDGSVRYLNAYPLVEGGERALPTPLSLFKRKKDELDDSDSLDVYNAAHEEAEEDERRKFEEDDTANQLSHPFCRIDPDADKQLTLYQLAPNRIAVHVLRDRAKGRATRENGAVFRYEALAEGQWFSGVVLVDGDDATRVELLLRQRDLAWLGRSRSANYGRVRISNIAVAVAETWREVGGSMSPADNMLSLTLLSDTLLRNASGQHTAMIDDETLSRYLGVSVTIDHERTITQPVLVGGYNRTWQLPLPQSTALKAGSVIVFTPADALDTRQLEWQGIGERRAEGFGRIAFNWQTKLHPTAKAGNLPSQAEMPSTLSAVAQRTAQYMARRLLDQRIEEAIQFYLRDHVLNKTLGSMPANSQLGRVRVLVRRTLNSRSLDMTRLRSDLDGFKPVAQNQFQSARFNGVSLWKWMHDLLAAPQANTTDQPYIEYKVWRELGIGSSDLPVIAGHRAELGEDLTYRTALRLIEAVFVAIARKSRREREEVLA
jgi:CRISPR-associated protein Csx10